jgi:hypothetical protein
MALPEKVREILYDVGQVALEVPCQFEGCREFVSVYMAPRDCLAADESFYYFENCERIFRVIRFRVETSLIEQDLSIGNDALFGLQQICLPSEEAVEFVLNLWQVDPADLLSPRDVEIPV